MADIFTTYGDRYENLLPQIIKDIEKEIALLTNPLVDGSMEDSAKLEYLLSNEAELKRYYVETFGQGYNIARTGGYADSVETISRDFADANIPLEYRPDQLDFMQKLKTSDALYFTSQSTASANITFDSMLKWAYTGSTGSLEPFIALIDESHVARYGSTIVNTQISTFYRSVNAMSAEEAGVTRFKYVGARDSRVRPFCRKLVGKVFTKEQINEMDNGQTAKGSVMRTGGGYNCRHRWVPVQGDE